MRDAVLAALLIGCAPAAPSPDASSDAAPNDGPDIGADSRADAHDAADAIGEVSADVPTDAGMDTAADVGQDAACDSGGVPAQCSGECVDLWTHPEHCGACAWPCRPPNTCRLGGCFDPDGGVVPR